MYTRSSLNKKHNILCDTINRIYTLTVKYFDKLMTHTEFIIETHNVIITMYMVHFLYLCFCATYKI